VFYYYGFTPSFILKYGSQYFKEDSEDVFVSGLNKNYTADEQMVILHRVQSAYFLAIILMQACHIFQIRSRTTSILERGVSGNTRVLLGVATSLMIGFVVVYVHVPIDVFETESPPASIFVGGVSIAAFLIYAYNEARKYWWRQVLERRNRMIDANAHSVLPISQFVDTTNRSSSHSGLGRGDSVSVFEKLVMW
jgi:magnesium-transporting ATPase (P-type)